METDLIAEFTFKNNYKSLPQPVKERTRLAVLNFIAVTIGANRYSQTSSLINTSVKIQQGDLPIFGSGKKAGLIGSVWANSALSHYLDFDDTHLETIVHPSAPVIPSSILIGISNCDSGETAIYSSAIGMEVSLRLALSVGLDERYSDWHNTSLYGTSASAIASAIMMKGTQEQLSQSMLEGLSVATGFLSNRGTETKSFQVGRSAAEGVVSAMAVLNGVRASKNMLNTFSKSLSGNSKLELLTEDLGTKWHVLNNFLKPYPCGVVLHPAIDAAIELRSQNLTLEKIEEINVFVNPVVMVLTAILEPKSGLEGKFSITHTVAAALVYGSLMPEHFSDDCVNNPEVVKIRSRVRVYQKEDVNRGQTVIEIKYYDGRVESAEVNRGPSKPSKLLDESDVRKKYMGLTIPVLGEEKANDIWTYFSKLDRAKDLSEVKEFFY